MKIKIAIGSDHAGFELKSHLLNYLKTKGIEASDKGCYSTERADYPDFGHAVANSVLSREADLGILGGIIKSTNVEGILQLDLLKTDYFHAKAYPTYLYYNPHASTKTVEIDAGAEASDVYDVINDQIFQKNVRGRTHLSIPADAARVVVLAQAGRGFRHDGKRTLIDNVVVRWAE